MFFRELHNNQQVKEAGAQFETQSQTQIQIQTQSQSQLQPQSQSNDTLQSIWNTEIQDVDSWACMKEYEEFYMSIDKIHNFNAHEFKQYMTLMPALKSDLIAIRKKIDSIHQYLSSPDRVNDPDQRNLVKLHNMKNGLERMYLYVQQANDDYSNDGFLKWVKRFVTSYRWSNEKTAEAALRIKGLYEACFKETSQWFDDNVVIIHHNKKCDGNDYRAQSKIKF